MYGFTVWITLTGGQVIIQRNVTLIHYKPATLVLESYLHGGNAVYEISDIVELQAWPEHELAAAFQQETIIPRPLTLHELEGHYEALSTKYERIRAESLRHEFIVKETKMPNCHNVALEAITEAVNILQLLAQFDHNPKWLTDSVPLQHLDELATSLGYPNARAIHSEIEGDREHEAAKHRDFDGPQLF